MRKWTGVAVALVVVLLFLVANRGAYKGYFSGDDLDNLTWTTKGKSAGYLQGLASLRLAQNNFRPVGHYYFHVLGLNAGLNFTSYVAVLQFIHLFNAAVLWYILRKLRIGPWAILAALVFFLFHMATFDAYWQPMYIFDVACAAFCLLSLASFIDRHWILSFLFLWLAYKAKEVAVMLPAVLLVYEYWLGEKRWKLLFPHVAFSACFGIQAVLFDQGARHPYQLHFSPGVLAGTLSFYAKAMFGWPLLGLVLLAALLYYVRDRRLYFGLASMVLLLIPMLALPGRLNPVYLYVPLIGAAIALGTALDHGPRYLAPAFLVAWLPLTYIEMREYRKGQLTLADENRAYVTQLQQIIRSGKTQNAYLFDGIPPALQIWGVSGAITFLTGRHDLQFADNDSEESEEFLRNPSLVILSWDHIHRKLSAVTRDPSLPDLPYVNVDAGQPIWQFKEGWYPRENYYRWTQQVALATVLRPANARAFEVYVNMSPLLLADHHSVKLSVSVDGEPVGEHEFTTPGWQKVRWPVTAQTPKTVLVQFRTDPPYHPQNDVRVLGIAIGGFGYIQ